MLRRAAWMTTAVSALAAIKGSVSKYVSQFATDNVNAYNPMFLATDSRTWNDLNGDDIAQDNEIGPSNNNAFGIRQSRNPDPHLQREYSIEYSGAFQHQLTSGISASVARSIAVIVIGVSPCP